MHTYMKSLSLCDALIQYDLIIVLMVKTAAAKLEFIVKWQANG
jgi:hypothetical protein